MAGELDQTSILRELEAIRDRLRAAEAQLSVLSAKTGVPYISPSAEAPPEVVELTRAGKRLDAMRKYRELTHSTVDEAQAVIDKI
jgi:hypothetical protein